MMAALDYFVIDRMKTGNRILVFRKQMHLSREGLACILMQMGIEVSVNSVGKWERGEVDISFKHAKALSKVFGCDLYDGLVVWRLREIEDDGDQPVPYSALFSVFFSAAAGHGGCRSRVSDRS